jgi:hypothetical protein
MVDSDSSESTGHYGEENMPTRVMIWRGRGGRYLVGRTGWL